MGFAQQSIVISHACGRAPFYCLPGDFSDVETLANLAINSFSLKLQVANLVLRCSPSTSIKICAMENAKLTKIKRRDRLMFGKR